MSDTAQKPDEETAGPAVVAKAQQTAKKVMNWFPVRVWQRFNERNGQTLAAGASYQALFAMFAALYVAFAGVGLWLGGNSDAIDGLIDVINGYLPGVIGESGSGAVMTREAVHQVASQSLTTLGVTGIVSLLVVLWTAVGWIGSIRVTIRDIFGLPAEQGNFVWLKVRDLLAAIGFAVLMLIGAVLGWAGTAALGWVFSLFGWTDAGWLQALGTVVTIVAMLLVNAVTLMMLFRFLTGTALQSRDVIPGALVGAVAITVLQLAFGFLIGKTPSNPLLVTFAVLIGLLAWIRLVMMAMLVAAAWVAVSAEDHDLELVPVDPEEERRREADTLVDAATIELRRLESEAETAGVFTRGRARRRVAHAENELARLQREREALED